MHINNIFNLKNKIQYNSTLSKYISMAKSWILKKKKIMKKKYIASMCNPPGLVMKSEGHLKLHVHSAE
jgi:hypothetical protein